MKMRKRPVVQLTSLLDLLFIMIFIGLLTPYAEPPGATENVVKLKQSISKLKSDNEKMKVRLEIAGANESSSQASEAGQYRSLFTANLFYRDTAGKYQYKETKVFFANDDTGIYSYRLNMTESGVIQGRKKPFTKTEADDFKKCTSVAITRDKIVEECTHGPGWKNKLDCKRASDQEYHCKLYQKRQNEKGAEKEYAWDYKMNLIKIHDPAFI